MKLGTIALPAVMALLAVFATSCCRAVRNGAPDAGPRDAWQELVMYGTQTASSTLGGEDWEADRAPTFSIRNLGDMDSSNCWAEGAPGPGIGQRIYLTILFRPKSLAVVNGWAKSEEAFREHCRVKTFRATVLHAMHLEGDYAGAGDRLLCSEYRESRRLELADSRQRQVLPLDFDWEAVEASSLMAAKAFEREFGGRIAARARQTGGEGYGRIDVLCLEIAEIYPGSRFEHTCLSEIDLE